MYVVPGRKGAKWTNTVTTKRLPRNFTQSACIDYQVVASLKQILNKEGHFILAHLKNDTNLMVVSW